MGPRWIFTYLLQLFYSICVQVGGFYGLWLSDSEGDVPSRYDVPETDQATAAQLNMGNHSQVSLITSKMRLDEIIAHLVQHGCQDITSSLDWERCTRHPFTNGGSGSIYQGWLHDGQPVAIKCIEVLGNWASWIHAPKSLKHAAHELYTWSKCDHPSILRVLGFARFGGHILVISPWMQKGCIRSYIEHHPQCNRLQLCIQLSTAVEYLHSKGLIHGDIKPDNIVISDYGHAQIADFGSAIMTNYHTLCFTDTGYKSTLRFTAPELLTGASNTFTLATDVYALGMTALQIISGTAPFANKSNPAIICEVVVYRNKPTRPDFGGLCGDRNAEAKLWNLLMRCWAYTPEERPTAKEVKEVLVSIGQL